MVSFDVLAGATTALLSLWIALAAWIVGSRVRADRLRRTCQADAGRLSDGADPSRWRGRRLHRLADGEHRSGAAEAARELVRRDSSRLLRIAQGRGARSTHALRVLARGGSPLAFDLLRSARSGGTPDMIAAVVGIAAEQQTPAADDLLIDMLVTGDHPRSRIATELAPRAPRLVGRLLKLAVAAEPEVRYWALMLLREAASDPRAKAAAVEASTDTEGTVRAAAARVLGAGGSSDVQHVLLTLIGDDVFFVRAHAARAAGEIRAVHLASAIATLLADQSWWVRAAAKESLLVLGWAGLAAAAGKLEADDPFARDGAAEVVSAFKRQPQAMELAG